MRQSTCTAVQEMWAMAPIWRLVSYSNGAYQYRVIYPIDADTVVVKVLRVSPHYYRRK